MDPQTYVEFDTDLQVALFQEWSGREYARSISRAYPVPPDSYTPTPLQPDPPPEAYTYYYFEVLPKLGGGGVIELDDASVAFATQEQTLSDGRTYVYDITANAKTADQLSAGGQAAIAPPSMG